MRASRWSFAKGINAIGKPEEGEVRFINDAVFARGKALPAAHPDPTQGEVVELEARHLFRHRGRSYTSAKRRHYAVTRFAGSEIIAWSEPGSHARCLYRGKAISLGLQRPTKAPVLATADAVSVILSKDYSTPFFEKDETHFYRFVFQTPFGSFAPTKSQKVTMDQPGFVVCNFSRGQFSFPIEKILVFRGEVEGDELFIGYASQSTTGYVFTDTKLPQGAEKAKDYEPVTKTSKYIYTFRADGYESAPSKISEPLPTKGATLLKFDLVNDGFWEQPGLVLVQGISSFEVKGPLAMASTAPSTGTLADLSASAKESSHLMHGGRCAVQGDAVWVSGYGVRARYVDPSTGAQDYGVARFTWSRQDPQDGTSWIAGILDHADYGTAASSFVVNHGGTVAGWAFDGARGGFRVNLGPNSVGTGERLVFMKMVSNAIAERCVITAYRSVVADSIWGLGTLWGAWQDGDSIKWAREGLSFRITSAQALALKDLEDGTLVRFGSRQIQDGALRTGRAYLSPSVLFIECDTSGIEALSTALDDLQIEYYPANNGIRSRAIYRVADTGEWLFVGEASLSDDIFCDSSSTSQLGDAVPSLTIEASGAVLMDEPPPLGLSFLTLHEGVLHGLDRDIARWSRKGRPHAWPQPYQAMVPGARAMCSTGRGVLILTDKGGVRLDGADPSFYAQVETEIQDGILAPLSLVTTPFGALYLGSRGIIRTDGHTSECLTDEQIRPWALFPAVQANGYGELSAGFQLAVNHLLDTAKGRGAGWVGLMESAATHSALAKDDSFGLSEKTETLIASYAVGHYFNGSYYLFIPADMAVEGHGSWRLDLKTRALTHMGLQPFWMAHEGQDLFLLLPASE